jgi:hypothetical protein
MSDGPVVMARHLSDVQQQLENKTEEKTQKHFEAIHYQRKTMLAQVVNPEFTQTLLSINRFLVKKKNTLRYRFSTMHKLLSRHFDRN